MYLIMRFCLLRGTWRILPLAFEIFSIPRKRIKIRNVLVNIDTKIIVFRDTTPTFSTANYPY